MDNLITQVICSRCERPPQKSYVTGFVFVTHICYENCGNVFWTLRKCQNCKVQNYTKIVNKPKTGQSIKCNKCNYQCFYLRCPYQQCKDLMFMSSNIYQMGQTTSCTTCNREFKLIICNCGGLLYKDPSEILYEGVNQYVCKECDKKVIYSICPCCLKPDYYFETQEIGNKIKCSHCKQARDFIPCPDCGRSVFSKDFHFGEIQKCHYCNCQFQFIMCPSGCGLNFYKAQNYGASPYRDCKRGCNIKFVVLNCNKCKYPLYIQNYDFGFAREEQCPSCKAQIKFHLCQCGLLTKNSNKCANPTCPIPKDIKNYTKEWKKLQQQKSLKNKPNMQQKKQQNTGGYDAKQCKLCYDSNSNMVNQTCRHMMMCQQCYRNLRARQHNDLIRCPTCKQPGKYHKFVEPILQ